MPKFHIRLCADKFSRNRLQQILLGSFTSLKSNCDGSGSIRQMQLKSTFKYFHNINGEVFLIKENNGSILWCIHDLFPCAFVWYLIYSELKTKMSERRRRFSSYPWKHAAYLPANKITCLWGSTWDAENENEPLGILLFLTFS